MQIRLRGHTVNLATGGVEPDAELPLVLMIHGAGMDRTVWNLQTRFLAHHGFSPLAVDLPGHGYSDGPLLQSLPEMVAWVGELIDALDRGSVRLVGHSMGALIALEVAAARADVERLVLMGAAMAMPVHPELIGAAERNDVLAPELMTAWGLGSRAHVATNPTPGLWMVGGGQVLLERAAPGVIANDLKACNAYEAGDVAGRVSCPVTVLVGSADRMTPPKAAAALVAGFDDVEVVHLRDIGHTMMSEAPDQVRNALLAALEPSGE